MLKYSSYLWIGRYRGGAGFRALERELGRLEAEADVADIPQTLLALLRERALAAEEDGVLLLVRLLRLIGFPMSLRHLCRLSRAASPCGVRPAFEKGECDAREERVLPRWRLGYARGLSLAAAGRRRASAARLRCSSSSASVAPLGHAAPPRFSQA